MPVRLPLEILQEIAARHGFPVLGVTDTAPLADFNRYVQWLQTGCHGSMQYLETSPGIEIRANPQLFLPEARSIVVLGARYALNRCTDGGDGLYGRVASYAWGSDYHPVLRRQAEQVVTELSRYAGQPFPYRTAIDSAPVCEKPLAQRAGLGWQGKNTCLIHPQQGSFFFLACLFTSMELEITSSASAGHCGSCHRCLDACPTGCILPDRTINARKCISYLTIENKGAIPIELRPTLGRWIFGCDICQSVCPWNRKPDNAGVSRDFLPASKSNTLPDLLAIIHLSESEFKIRFKDSPILRSKRRGLLRNAAVALGNYRTEEAAVPLTFLLHNEPDALIRAHAAWGLGQIPAAQARNTLSDCLKTESDDVVLKEIRQTLAAN